jgi:O-antigen/teichoic acid export membrane protein
MSLKRNVFANYASQIYITLIGVLMVPLYIKYMGPEAYGLVGFFAMLQAWFNLLDIGLTPTMARETARFRGGATDALNYRRLVRALEGIFLVIALAGGSALYSASSYIAHDWLQATQLPAAEVQIAIQLMAVIVALRWMCGLYRGAISGSERLVWLSGFNSIISTLRFVGILPVLMFIGVTPTIFFSFQFAVAIIEFVTLMAFAYHLFPSLTAGQKVFWDWEPLKPVLKFSLTIAFTSSVWVLVTQTDKLILSKLLPLGDYGYYSLAVLVAGGVLVIGGPVSAAIMPRMSKMEAESDHVGLIKLYRNSTQLVCVLAIPVACTLAIFAEQILWAWTGDPVAAQSAAPIMKLYVLGNAVLVVGAFPYYLQYAKGDLQLHLIGSGLLTLILIPSMVWATINYGAIGAGWAWLVSHTVGFLLWIPVVHRRFERGLHLKWVLLDIMPMAITAALCAWLFTFVTIRLDDRTGTIFLVFFIGIALFLMTLLSSSMLRLQAWQLIRSKIIWKK